MMNRFDIRSNWIQRISWSMKSRYSQIWSTQMLFLWRLKVCFVFKTIFNNTNDKCILGIGYEKPLICLIKAYASSSNLVFIMNYSDSDLSRLKLLLKDVKHVHEAPTLGSVREKMYLEGGIHFVTTRVLVVDLLKKRIPIELITGIIVLKAHKIVESCQETFALQLYRKLNKTGFIKAFSSNAEAFTIGYSHLEKTMRNLFVKELYIWPRFHSQIQSSLKDGEIQAIELNVPATDKMVQMQYLVLDLMNFLVKEIKRINRTVDMEEITVENCVTKEFYKILQAQLDCIWHQLNNQTKLIISDLKVLRNIMLSIIYQNCIRSYDLIMKHRTTEYALNNSGWVLSDSAEKLFKLAKDRVFNSKGEFEPEPTPKWRILEQIINVEIPGKLVTCYF